jgi:DNA-binding NarL/FixJ family response regulator
MIKVAVIEDQPEMRQALSALFESAENFRCAGSFESMEQAMIEVRRDLPDLVLVDIGLPGITGIEGIRQLKERHPAMLFLVLTVYEDDERIFQALCAGACGYLLKKTQGKRLLELAQEAIDGGSPMSPEVARRVVTLFQKFRPSKEAHYELTPHETRILQMLVEGHNYKSAAKDLKVSVNTICFHIRNIYQKLHVHSKSEAVAKALRNHVVRV